MFAFSQHPLNPSSARSQLWTALGLALAPVIALGFSRFAYALLLPPMKRDLAWSYTQAGGLNAANAVGYVAGAFTAAWAVRHLTAGRAFLWSLIVSALALFMTGLTSSYVALLAVRGVGGYSTAVAFVVGSALAARLKPSLLPVYFAGPGIGIVIASIVAPAALSRNPESGWKTSWLLLGVAAVLGVVGAWRAEKRVPAHSGRHAGSLTREQFRTLGPVFAAYVLFGAGYVSFMTFVIELLRDKGVSNWTSGAFFLVLGASSAVTTVLWGRPLHRLHGGQGLAVVSAATFIGSLPVLLAPGVGTAFISALVFGGSFMAGPSAVTALCRRCLPADTWAAGIAILTTGFAVGQAVGPVVSGLISDHLGGGVRSGLWLSPILLLAASAVALRQHDSDSGLLETVEAPEAEAARAA